MSQYKLIYLDFRARGELSRLLFALAGQEYEDVRFKREDWPAVKDKYIFGRIRTEHGYRQFPGQAVCTDVEVLEVDQVLGIVGDIRAALVRAFLERDEGRKAEIVTENKETNIPRFLGFLETVLKNNNTGYYVGDKLAYADVAAFDVVFAARIEESLMERFPLVKANFEKVKADEKIAQWLAKRPQTQI